MPRPCVACTAQVADGYLLCAFCAGQLSEDLTRVTELRAELGVTLSRCDHVTTPTRHGGDVGLPYRLAASEALAALNSTVVLWAGQVSRGRGSEVCPHDVDMASVWLGHRIDRLRAREDAGDAYDQIRAAVTRAWGVVDRPRNRAHFRVGPCPERGCRGEVWVSIPATRDHRAAMCCRMCATSWPATSWLRAGRRILRRMGDPVA